jgi:methanogenic corrinoid protein MtbC1
VKAKLLEAYLEMNRDAAVALVEAELAAGTDPLQLLEANQAAMEEVGKSFETGEFFISELIYSAEICKSVSAILEPSLAEIQQDKDPNQVVVFGTPKGDIHDLGKNLAIIILRAQGFEVHDLGVDVPPEKFIEELKRTNAPILAMSALITPTFMAIKEIMRQLDEEGLRDKTFVIIGGAVTNDLAKETMGADAQTKDPMEGAKMCREFVQSLAA